VADRKVNSNGNTTGTNLALHINLIGGGVSLGKLKLSALDGNEDVQGELGVGYNFLAAKPLAFGGLNVPHAAFGFDGTPYITLHTSWKIQ
jgi:hypothetical protein